MPFLQLTNWRMGLRLQPKHFLYIRFFIRVVFIRIRRVKNRWITIIFKELVNPFSTNVPLLYPLKTSENLRSSSSSFFGKNGIFFNCPFKHLISCCLNKITLPLLSFDANWAKLGSMLGNFYYAYNIWSRKFYTSDRMVFKISFRNTNDSVAKLTISFTNGFSLLDRTCY